mmetsp:Transcript_11444/g.22709  ORF Transcript_11444/g.22709 Transcript_11444/m.22709 type:complete len:221 (+) Transcript_11444:213-875(+)
MSGAGGGATDAPRGSHSNDRLWSCPQSARKSSGVVDVVSPASGEERRRPQPSSHPWSLVRWRSDVYRRGGSGSGNAPSVAAWSKCPLSCRRCPPRNPPGPSPSGGGGTGRGSEGVRVLRRGRPSRSRSSETNRPRLAVVGGDRRGEKSAEGARRCPFGGEGRSGSGVSTRTGSPTRRALGTASPGAWMASKKLPLLSAPEPVRRCPFRGWPPRLLVGEGE